jgi:hypothetical protein
MMHSVLYNTFYYILILHLHLSYSIENNLRHKKLDKVNQVSPEPNSPCYPCLQGDGFYALYSLLDVTHMSASVSLCARVLIGTCKSLSNCFYL